MKKYVIASILGKQFILSEGDKVILDRVNDLKNDLLEIKDILLYVDGDKVEIGSPLLKSKVLKLKLLKEYKDKKIIVAKYKAKSRYHKVNNHKQAKSLLEVISIN